MGLTDPKISKSEKFSDHFEEGQAFRLLGIRTVAATSAEYGKGQMVLLRVQGHDAELGIWGDYLLRQAESADHNDMGKDYIITREVVPEFSSRPVKILKVA